MGAKRPTSKPTSCHIININLDLSQWFCQVLTCIHTQQLEGDICMHPLFATLDPFEEGIHMANLLLYSCPYIR